MNHRKRKKMNKCPLIIHDVFKTTINGDYRYLRVIKASNLKPVIPQKKGKKRKRKERKKRTKHFIQMKMGDFAILSVTKT